MKKVIGNSNQRYYDRLRKCQYTLLEEFPFYGKLLLSLPFGLNPYCPTAYTDMKQIIFSPSFIDELTDLELKVVILHELLHCVLFHCTRGKGKIQYLYNIACDLVVNSIIYQSFPLDTLASYPFNHTYKMQEGYQYSAEEIYEDMMKNHYEEEWEGYDLHDAWAVLCQDEQLEKDFDSIIQTTLKTSGNEESNTLRKILEERYKPQLNWKEQLYELLSYTADLEDYSFSRRDTRYFDQEYCIPSLEEEDEVKEMNNIFIAIDVSGSISDREFQAFKKEIEYQCDILNIKGYYSFFDTSISEPCEFNSEEKIKFDAVLGYGGTNFHIVFKQALELDKKIPLKAMILFTDGYATIPPQIDIPIIWIINNNDITPDYGTVLRMVD